MYIKIRGYNLKVSHHRHVRYCSCTNNNVYVTSTYANGYHYQTTLTFRARNKCHRLYIGEVFLGHAVKAYRGSRGIAPPILNLGTKRKRVTNFMPRPLYLRTRTAVTTEEAG